MMRTEACERYPLLAEYLSPSDDALHGDGFGLGDAEFHFWVSPAEPD